jgi:hypothetical protein
MTCQNCQGCPCRCGGRGCPLCQEGFKGSSNSSVGRSMLSNSGLQMHGGAITMCTPSDTSFYCTMNRIFAYISFFIMILAIIYIIYVFGLPFITKRSKQLGFFDKKK